MKVLIIILGLCLVSGAFARDTRGINPNVEGSESNPDSVRGGTAVNSYLTKGARDAYNACVSVCTIEAVRAECLTDCSRSSVSPIPRQVASRKVAGDNVVVTSYASVGDVEALKETLPDPMDMLSAKNSFKQHIGATTPAATTPKIDALEFGRDISEVKVVAASIGRPGVPTVERSHAAMDSHESAGQGADTAKAQSIVMMSQAIDLMIGNPTAVELNAAEQLMKWAQDQAAQERHSRQAANQNWQQCILLKGNYEKNQAPNPSLVPQPPVTGSTSGCGDAPKESEFVVTPELAAKLDNFGIGRLEFQGKVQAGDWAWVRSALNITSTELSEEEAAAAQTLANGSAGFSRQPTSTHADAQDFYSPPQSLQADAISYGASSPLNSLGTSQVQGAAPSDQELRAAGVVPLPSHLSVFAFASRKFANWQRSIR